MARCSRSSNRLMEAWLSILCRTGAGRRTTTTTVMGRGRRPGQPFPVAFEVTSTPWRSIMRSDFLFCPHLRGLLHPLSSTGVLPMLKQTVYRGTLGLVLLCASLPSIAQSSGADTYKAKCQMCHGADGLG